MPLTEPPLRQPGQSVMADLDDRILLFVALCVLPVTILFVGILNSLWQLIIGHGQTAIIGFSFSLTISVLIFFLCLPKLRRCLDDMRNCYLGFMAESFVGQQLERARFLGFSVFHDIVVDDKSSPFNIDHLLIGERGIFVVETKGKSKALKGKPKLVFDGHKLNFPDGTYTDEPIEQIRANMNWAGQEIIKILKRQRNPVCQFRSSQQLPVTGLIVYPGWFVKRKGFSVKNVAVLTDKPMLRYLRRCRKVLNKDEAKELSDLFGEYQREKQRELLM